MGGGVFGYTAQADAAKPLGLQYLYGDDDQDFVGAVLAPLGVNGVLPISNRQIGFINFNQSPEPLAARANHGTAEAMQEGPGSLVATQAQHAL